MAEETKPSNKFTLKTSDNQEFEVDKDALMLSQTIKPMIEDNCADSVIPIPNVTGDIMKSIIEYCEKHVEFDEKKKKCKALATVDGNDDGGAASLNDEIKAWDAQFIKVDMDTLYNLLLATNFLGVMSLMDLATQSVADMIKGKRPEAIRKTFGIKNDLTPEQHEEHMRLYYWAYLEEEPTKKSNT